MEIGLVFVKILIVQYFHRYLSYYFGSSDKGKSSGYNGLGNLEEAFSNMSVRVVDITIITSLVLLPQIPNLPY
jgi:hypothetical protein